MISFDVVLADAGNFVKERVIMTATADVDIAYFSLFCCTASAEDEVAAGDIPRVFWFEERKMKKGDLAVLYTKQGTTSEKKNKNGSTSTFYYWGLKGVLWTPQRRPVLVSTPEYKFGEFIDEEMTTAERA